MSVKKVTTFFRAGDHFGDQWIANKMGMIANMILNFGSREKLGGSELNVLSSRV